VVSSSADRVRAARILIRTERGAYASRMLAARADAGVRARVLGVLRWLRALDSVLAPLCSRPVGRLDPEVRAALRIGLFESAVMGVPRAVATDAAVRLVRRLAHGSAAGLVNAVLRRAVADWTERMTAAAPDVRLSHPSWLFRRWVDRYGSQRTEGAMEADQTPAPVWVWFVDDGGQLELGGQEVSLHSHPWCPDAWSSPEDTGRLLEAVQRGIAYVQDPSSMLVARLATRLATGSGRFVDLCAAPGGKAALLGRHGGWSSGIACDLRIRRVRLMSPLLDGVGACSSVVSDSAKPPLRDGAFDLVLLDAPCTGTGTLRRHPELRWRLQPESVVEMAALQKKLVAAAPNLVAPNGVLVYATCSVEPEENEELFPAPPDGFDVADLESVLPDGVPAISTDAGGIRILPHLDGDGFTIHAFRRR